MKRQNGDDNGPQSKFRRNESGTSCLRVLIPSRAAGPIIGKGGETIKSLRSEYSVRLHIPDSRGPERVFYLEGETRSICGCLKGLTPRLLEVLNAKNADQRLLRIKNPDDDDEPEEEKETDPEKLLDVRILIHQSQVGSVIGKKGDRIKELQKDNHVNIIKIYQEVAPGSTDRVVQIIGLPDNVFDCIEGIMETLESSPIRGPKIEYDANYQEPEPMPMRSDFDRYPVPYDAPMPGYYPPTRGYDERPPMRSRDVPYDRRSSQFAR